jgi:ankyrin repeat protein
MINYCSHTNKFTSATSTFMLAGATGISLFLPSVFAIHGVVLPVIFGIGAILAASVFIASIIPKHCNGPKGLSKVEASASRYQLDKCVAEILPRACGSTEGKVSSFTESYKKEYDVYLHIKNLLAEIRKRGYQEADLKDFQKLLYLLPDINYPYDDIPLLILLAQWGKPVQFLKILEESGADFSVRDKTLWKNTALLWAIANAKNEIALELIVSYHDRQNLNAADQYKGDTPLILAVAKGYKDKSRDEDKLTVSNLLLVQRLLEYGADPNIANKKEWTPLKLAILRRDSDMVKALMSAGAKINFNPQPLLEMSYDDAKNVLSEHTLAFLLDSETFESSKQEIQKIISLNSSANHL